MSPWATAALAIGSAFVTAAGKDLVLALFGRRRNQVDAVRVLTDTAVALTGPLGHELDRMRVEQHEFRVEQDRLRDEARRCADQLYRLRTAILDPTATIDGLRELVRRVSDPGQNGRP